MSAKKKKPQKNSPPINVSADSVSVRMYCHGFGDCFLLTFKDQDIPVYRMLIDCGMLTGDTDTLRQTIQSIKQEGKINLVVQTHEHKDHVSGFNLKDKKTKKLLWDEIPVDQVWLAWTEDTGRGGDSLANDLKSKHEKKKKSLTRALGLYRKQINSAQHKHMLEGEYHGSEYFAAQKRYAEALGQVLNFFDIGDKEVENALQLDSEKALSLTINDAMNYFKEKCETTGLPEIFFWDPGEQADHSVTGLSGVRFYFLGPPKDYDKLRYMEDSTHEEMYMSSMGLSDNFYLALDGKDTINRPDELSPFNTKYFWKPTEDEQRQKENVWKLYHQRDNDWRAIEMDWLHNTGALALHLDSYTNNTSLVIAIELEASGKVLLFAADAQIGNWISWTEPISKKKKEPKLSWQVPKNGKQMNVTAQELLQRTVFYKVGHHASHNATAKKHGLEMMESKELVAMIPVDEKVASKQGKRGWKMPAEKLYKRLQHMTKGRIIRLDKGNMLANGMDDLPPASRPSIAQLNEFENRFSKSATLITTDAGNKRPLYLEYHVR